MKNRHIYIYIYIYIYYGSNRGKDRSDGKTGRILKQILDDLKEKRGYWKLKEEVLVCTL
jgi:hypothetical protein